MSDTDPSLMQLLSSAPGAILPWDKDPEAVAADLAVKRTSVMNLERPFALVLEGEILATAVQSTELLELQAETGGVIVSAITA